MNKRTEQAIYQENGALFSAQDPGEGPGDDQAQSIASN